MVSSVSVEKSSPWSPIPFCRLPMVSSLRSTCSSSCVILAFSRATRLDSFVVPVFVVQVLADALFALWLRETARKNPMVTLCRVKVKVKLCVSVLLLLQPFAYRVLYLLVFQLGDEMMKC